MEKVTVIIPTYNRPHTLYSTIRLMHSNLVYDGPVQFLVGDDSGKLSFETITRPMVEDLSGFMDIKLLSGPARGLGANLNMLIEAADSRLILQMDDDHFLVKPLDINQFADDLLQFKNKVGWIRLFLGTEEDLNNDDPFYNFNAWMMERYWYPMPNRYELYIPSNRPHLKHVQFHHYHGSYDEGVKLGKTETNFCHYYADNYEKYHSHQDFPWVVIPVAAPSFDTWEHVGDSWQKQGL